MLIERDSCNGSKQILVQETTTLGNAAKASEFCANRKLVGRTGGVPERGRRRVHGGRALEAGRVRVLRVRRGRTGAVRPGAVSAGRLRRARGHRGRLLSPVSVAAPPAAPGRRDVSLAAPRGRVVARRAVHLVRLPQAEGRLLRAEVSAGALSLPRLHHRTLLSRLHQ